MELQSLKNEKYFIENVEKLGFKPENYHIELFRLFYDELLKWNEHTNLTRITEEKEFIDKHLLDSLSCIKAIDKELAGKPLKVIDIGTGAGFPLLPLWFFYPHWKITLLDSVKKKLNFIGHFSEIAIEKYPQLKAENIEIIHSRAEDLAKDKAYREKYDIIFSRAVASLASLVELSLPFVKINGNFIGMKSADVGPEVAEAKNIIRRIGGQHTDTITFELLETGLQRALVIIKKVKATPADFPRKAGMAQKNPLI
jgi:16S rRNA (guanine527-N7)-methyltransferase